MNDLAKRTVIVAHRLAEEQADKCTLNEARWRRYAKSPKGRAQLLRAAAQLVAAEAVNEAHDGAVRDIMKELEDI